MMINDINLWIKANETLLSDALVIVICAQLLFLIQIFLYVVVKDGK